MKLKHFYPEMFEYACASPFSSHRGAIAPYLEQTGAW